MIGVASRFNGWCVILNLFDESDSMGRDALLAAGKAQFLSGGSLD